MKKEIKALSNKCSSCGYTMVFNPESSCIYCPSCKSHKKIEHKTDYSKHDVNKDIKLVEKNTEWADQNKVMLCSNCGASTVLNKFQASANCPYCNSNLIASPQHFKGLKPDAILPFKFGREKAAELFKEKIKNKWLVPSKFKKSVSANEIHGYYFPAFVFDADCETSYSGRLYETYTVEDSDGNSETKRKYFNISGNKQTNHSNIEVEASSKLSQYDLNLVRPYNLSQAKAYNDAYVFGFEMEYYNNSVNNCFNQAQTIMKQDIKKSILKDYKYDGIESFSMDNKFYNPKYSYVLMPMYRINYNHKNKNYSNNMNGQTGALGGNYPKSGLKISLIAILAMLLFLVPIILILMFIL